MRRKRIIRLFIAGGVLVFSALWWAESAAGIILPFDSHAYPVVIGFLAASLAIMLALPQFEAALELACFLGVAIYMLLLIAVIGFGGGAGNIYTVANTLLWMPVIYVAAFVFFPRRRAIIATWGTFAISLIVLGGAFLVHSKGVASVGVQLLLANAVGCHMLVLLCLSLVTALRQEFERVASHARLMEDAANTDPLTGIANRRGLEQWLASESAVPSERASLILFDIDHFKSINDRFGHLVGDEVLFSTAQLIKSQLHGGDIVGRWGGEEFLVIMPGGSLPSAAALADRVRQIVSASSHPVAGMVTLSAGIAVWQDDLPIVEAFRAADTALASAKRNGRDRVIIH
ncbi:GGDEF domain-containing protein [Kaistia dalseonensis]|uniref:diguanylate cyclase n=1 Tax=Kaistia dalseonensis TaxID=410840 RepID=A0ABU0H256_9HYPH|nr:GGDEF domain-containing protein [Kaistia dalseonensis]MCX5493816.1 GGDEF domain-containing protein [Kaistia dalseonensis]MDQ0436381.1 diguanylate cyclase (GGDEF)-like protein [Kaistia dalseonensis]